MNDFSGVGIAALLPGAVAAHADMFSDGSIAMQPS
jgi:hypothetical protein